MDNIINFPFANTMIGATNESTAPVLTVPVQEEPAKEQIREIISTKSIGFNEMLLAANAIQAECDDYMLKKVNSRNFTFNEDATMSFGTDDGRYINAKISQYALTQLGTKIGVPGNYIQKCIDANKGSLAALNVNDWIKEYKGGFFLRGYRDSIRGVLSPRYSICDAPRILDILGDAVNMDDYKIKGSYINEERMHIRFIGNEMLRIDGEDLFPAIMVDSSDVGRSTLVITFGIFKLVCTNGLIIARAGGLLYKQRHIGIDEQEFMEQIVASVKNIPMLSENAIEWVRRAKSEKIDTEKMIALMRNMHINDAAQEKVVDLMNHRYFDNSKWGFINGVTEVAQDYTLEKRIEIERLAGSILAA